MQAGRELDALVAEKVMGWDVGDIFYDATHQEIMPRVSSYSTNIAAAWEVVVKFQFCYLYRASDMNNGQWECKLHREDNGREYYVLADTAPLAICLAALKAVGVMEDVHV